VKITDTASFKNVWSLVGQGQTLVNAADMAMIAGAVANGGKTAVPYIVESVTNPNKDGKVLYEVKKETKENKGQQQPDAKLMEFCKGLLAPEEE
jgi:cell division protein FtsI/penicillin-binding protein 2